ncbi:MAG: hypothetical protein LBL43_05585 [Treponema sp.]|jgi:drug/metabolite transporter (DMT)-like permease|nr:hypothetical protein [Treponema sp.]
MRRCGLKKQLFLVLSLCGAVVLLFAPVYIFTHLDHDCPGEDCETCLRIEWAANLVKGAGAFCLVRYAVAIRVEKYRKMPSLPFVLYPVTAVALKVQFNT